MTPLVAEMVGLVPDKAEHWMWFDFQEAWETSNEFFDHERTINALRTNLPFKRCALVAGPEDAPFLLMVSEAIAKNVYRDDPGKTIPVVAVAGVLCNKKTNKQDILPLFSIDTSEDDIQKGLTIHFDRPEFEKEMHLVKSAKNSLVAIAFWLERMGTKEMKAYTPVSSKSNPKRLRQGKKPLFDWHTVVLEPRSAQESMALGGTHSSPRLHDVRGHWVVRGSKRFWRKPHKRGDASKGVIFHDYKLKGERHDHV